MQSQAYFLAASALTAYCSLLSAASAQTNDSVGSEVPQPTAPADLRPVQTGVAEPTASTPPSAIPSPTIPLSQDEHRDVMQHTWPNRPMLVTGLVVLGGTYGASAIVAAASDRKADDKLFLPVVGPWLDLKNRDCQINDCGSDTFNKALLIGDGALQGIGALSIVLSLVIPESTKKPWYLIGDEKLSVSPQVGTAVTGLTASGNF